MAKALAIEGDCLCGAIHIVAAHMPRTVTQCNCSVCRRYGTLWAYYQRRAVVIAPRSGLEAYKRRPRGLDFMRCKRCGCIVSWEWKRGAGARMALNARLFDHARIAKVKVSVLDGDKTWRVVDSYAKPAMFVSPKR